MRIFISYRRKDSHHITDRIYDRLVDYFGRESLFKDVDSIPLGTDFREIVQASVRQCHALLAVIGGGWLRITDDSGRRRLDNPDDLVRIEIETALRQGIPVIPILVDGTNMPSAHELPDSLQAIAFRNGTTVGPDPDFHRDLDRVIQALGQYEPEKSEHQPPRDGIPRHKRPKKNVAQDLEIIAVHTTKDWELDITLRNTGDQPAVIHGITITVLEEHGVCLPVIKPSAKYDIPIGDLKEGQSRSIPVSHFVELHGVDRFKVALHTTACLVLRLTLQYNRVQTIEALVGVRVELEPEEIHGEDTTNFITWPDLRTLCGTPVCARCLSHKELLQALHERRVFWLGPPWVVTEEVQLGDLNEERVLVRAGNEPPRRLVVFPRPLPQGIRMRRRNFLVPPSDIVNSDTPAKSQELRANECLLEAAAAGNLDDLKAALARGADINVRRQGRPGYRSWWGTVRRENALALAALNGHLNVVRFLLDHCANLANPCGSYAWYCAAYHGRNEIAKVLEEAGVTLELTDGQRQRVRERQRSRDDGETRAS
jgi:hypothetical protein